MTSQSSLMVAAKVDRKSLAALKAVLSTMNLAPGQADPANALVPFGKLENLHFARFTILDDETLDDIQTVYHLPRQEYPIYLALLFDFDGDPATFLADLVKCAAPGLRRVFAFCDDFPKDVDLLQWMREHDTPAATNYVNWRGRTAKQIREEAAVRQSIATYRRAHAGALQTLTPEQVRVHLRKALFAQGLNLTPPEPTPFGTKIANLFHFVGVGLLIGLLIPPVALLVLFRIRPLEKSDPVFAPRPTPEHANSLARIEDYEVTNQFSAMGSLKPGLARQWIVSFVLLVIQWTGRHIFNKGRLARVRTIHFARWVFLDGKKRIYFASNYDGSLDSYMDDFINKVFFGLNVVFCNGIGYPSTTWLLGAGARDEQKFKYFLRRHEMPTEVWYNAHPSVTVAELERNGRIRQGLEAEALSSDAARDWVQLL
jgi:hypothetical protein